jgi:uncharacterized protein involved in exopolysaccharide biosynthesis
MLAGGLFRQSAMQIRQMKILGLALLLGGLALAGAGLWLLLSPAQYAATARIHIKGDVSDIGISPANGLFPYGVTAYDSYFIQTTFEIIQSQLVLGIVVTNLNLNKVWGDKYFNGARLETTQSIKIIKGRMRLAPVRNMELIAIRFCSDDSNEAALVANAIASAYRDYRVNLRREIIKKGLETIQQQYQDEEKQISLQPTNREQLLEYHKLLAKKIEEVKVEQKNMEDPRRLPMVQIVDRAEPSQFPVSPNRSLGAVLLAVGLLSLLAGIFLLKPARQSAD